VTEFFSLPPLPILLDRIEAILSVLFRIKTLKKWKQKGAKIVHTHHDEITHYTKQPEESKKLFDIIESEANAIIHLGHYSKERFLEMKMISGQLHYVIPHHIYDTIHSNKISGNEARELLNINAGKFVILAFGSFHAQEEKKLIANAFEQLNLPDKLLLSPSWYYNNDRKDMTKSDCFLGEVHVEEEMVPYYFAAADVVFLQRLKTINSGNLSMAFLFNKTVVGPAIGNMNEYLDNVHNFSFNPYKPQSVISALEAAYARYQSPQINKQYALDHWTTAKIAEMHPFYLCIFHSKYCAAT
jgi:hypothetical protein